MMTTVTIFFRSVLSALSTICLFAYLSGNMGLEKNTTPMGAKPQKEAMQKVMHQLDGMFASSPSDRPDQSKYLTEIKDISVTSRRSDLFDEPSDLEPLFPNQEKKVDQSIHPESSDRESRKREILREMGY